MAGSAIAEALLKARLAKLEALIEGEWDLPLLHEQEGHLLTATCTLKVQVDLDVVGYAEADRLVRLMFKQAILQAAGWG